MKNLNIGLNSNTSAEIAKILNAILSDEYLLQVKTQNFHWNVEAPNFRELHLLFEDQYTTISGYVDTVAERVRAIGGRAMGSMAGFKEHTRLKEVDEHADLPDAQGMIAALVEDHEALARELRLKHSDIEERMPDIATLSMLEEMVLEHEKMAWFLRAHLSSQA